MDGHACGYDGWSAAIITQLAHLFKIFKRVHLSGSARSVRTSEIEMPGGSREHDIDIDGPG